MGPTSWFYSVKPYISRLFYSKKFCYLFCVSLYRLTSGYFVMVVEGCKEGRKCLCKFLNHMPLCHRGPWSGFSQVQYSQEALFGSGGSNVKSGFPARRAAAAAVRNESSSFLTFRFCQSCTRRGSDAVRTSFRILFKKKKAASE